MIKNVNDILLKSGYYYLISEASIRSDMAERIMYSIIQGIPKDKEDQISVGLGLARQQSETEKEFLRQNYRATDYKALIRAANGRHDIIKYGARACSKELSHYHGDRINVYEKTKSLLSQNKYKEVINIAIKAFSDYKQWDPAFGGPAWEAIARSLGKICFLDEYLDLIYKEYKTSMDSDSLTKLRTEELVTLQDLIVELNVFDGLSHNTESIMRNLVQQETLEKYPQSSYDYDTDENYDRIGKEFTKVKSLMDAKELEDPTDVYKEIYDSLSDIDAFKLKYKDWNAKIRSLPSYHVATHEKHDKLVFEKFKIRMRKESIQQISGIKETKNYIKSIEQIMRDFINGGPHTNGLTLVYELEKIYYKMNGNINWLVDNITYIPNKIALSLDKDNKNIIMFLSKATKLKEELSKKIYDIFTDELPSSSLLETELSNNILLGTQIKDKTNFFISLKKLDVILDECFKFYSV